MKERTLPFNDVPVIGIVVGRQPFGRACNEIRDDGIDRHARSRDEDPRLAGRTKGGANAPIVERPGNAERGIFLADGAVGAHGEQSPARALASRRDLELAIGIAHVEERAAVALGRLRDFRDAAEPRVHPACHIEPGIERRDDRCDPAGREGAADGRDANDESLRARRFRRRWRDFRNFKIDTAGRQAELAGAKLTPPMQQAEGGLGIRVVGDVAEEKEIGAWNRHGARGGCRIGTPDRAPVGEPCANTTTPLTQTRSMPTDSAVGSAMLERSETVTGSMSTRSAARPRRMTPRPVMPTCDAASSVILWIAASQVRSLRSRT